MMRRPDEPAQLEARRRLYARRRHGAHVRAPRPGRPVLVDFNAGGAARKSSPTRSGVSAARQLAVEEIIAGTGSSRRAGRRRRSLYGQRPDGAALPADRRPIPATTSSPRTAISSRPTASSGRSCRSRSTARIRRQPAAVSAAAAREGAVAAAAAALRRRLSLSARRHRDASTGIDCYVVTFDPVDRRTVALSRHGLDRPRRRLRESSVQAVQTQPVGAGRLERGDPDVLAR